MFVPFNPEGVVVSLPPVTTGGCDLLARFKPRQGATDSGERCRPAGASPAARAQFHRLTPVARRPSPLAGLIMGRPESEPCPALH
jgi:hypothetical protein